MHSKPIEVTCQDVKAGLDQGDGFVLIDCREQDEFEIVAIAGAQLVPMSCLQDRIAELANMKAERIVVFCHHGGRSLQVATWLRQQGFADAQSMAGGIDCWALEIDSSLPRY